MNKQSLQPIIEKLESLFSKFNEKFYNNELQTPVITVAPGTFPKKAGCEISNYPQKIYIDGMGFDAWGHIDYNEPLTDAEVKDYELQPARYEFSVKFNPDNEQMGRIHKLFKRWCEYVAEDGSKPFADYTVEKFFEVMMQSGSFHTMNRHIENMEYELK